MKNLRVFGSINMDLVAECPRFVEPGEALAGLIQNSPAAREPTRQ
jgi:hypothetical protein